MAKKLPPQEQARTRTDFDPPTETKRTGKGNPNGRPHSENPRTNNLHIRLSDEDAEKLEEAARLKGTTKTKVILAGISRIYDEAAAEAWKESRRQ